MVHIKLDRTYPVPVADVWARIEDFYDLSWLPAVEATRTLAERSSRVAVLPGGAGEVVEHLLEQGQRFHRYEVTEPGPMPLTDYTSTIRVDEVDPTTSRVVWQAQFEPAGLPAADAEAAVRGVFEGGLEHLGGQLQR